MPREISPEVQKMLNEGPGIDRLEILFPDQCKLFDLKQLQKSYIEEPLLRQEADRLHKMHEPGATAWPALNCKECLENAANNLKGVGQL